MAVFTSGPGHPAAIALRSIAASSKPSFVASRTYCTSSFGAGFFSSLAQAWEQAIQTTKPAKKVLLKSFTRAISGKTANCAFC
jgi:hypothetical protein